MRLRTSITVCTAARKLGWKSQCLLGDQHAMAARVLRALLGEMAALFSDEVFHIGADETFVQSGPKERCTANGTAALEKQIVDAVANDFGKTPAGWEQVLFKTGAATKETIVYAYMSGAGKVTATGHRAVVANGSSL